MTSSVRRTVLIALMLLAASTTSWLFLDATSRHVAYQHSSARASIAVWQEVILEFDPAVAPSDTRAAEKVSATALNSRDEIARADWPTPIRIGTGVLAILLLGATTVLILSTKRDGVRTIYLPGMDIEIVDHTTGKQLSQPLRA